MNKLLSIDWDGELNNLNLEDQWEKVKTEIQIAQHKCVPTYDNSKQNKWKMNGSVPLST